jgi:hypothetical protein
MLACGIVALAASRAAPAVQAAVLAAAAALYLALATAVDRAWKAHARTV